MKGLGLFFTAVSAIAAVISVIAAIQTSATESRMKENFQVAAALSEWSRNLNSTGAQCAAMLSQYSPEQFKDFSNRASSQLLTDQKQFLHRCTRSYKDGVFDEDGDLKITEKERGYISDQVIKQLNTYELLALKWKTFSEEAKSTICMQASIEKNSPYRTFYKIAEGTKWWNYPNLELFMKDCEG